jgi:uncharacterized cupin superfamily protein
MRAYRVARKPVEKDPLTGPELWRMTVPQYQTSDMIDRLGNEDFYKRLMISPPGRVARIKVTKKDDDELFYLEGSLMLKQEGRDKKLSKRKRDLLREYWG